MLFLDIFYYLLLCNGEAHFWTLVMPYNLTTQWCTCYAKVTCLCVVEEVIVHVIL